MNLGFYDTSSRRARALEVMNCKIAARWMSLHGRLLDWLATLRAGVVVGQVSSLNRSKGIANAFRTRRIEDAQKGGAIMLLRVPSRAH